MIVRTGHVLDPGGGFLAKLLPPFKLGVGGPLAGGEQYVSWIHVEDEVGLILWAIENEAVSGVVNLTAPNPVTNRELSKALGRALHRPAAMPVPGFALDLMYGSEFGAVLRGGQRVVPRRAQDLGYEFRHPKLDEALADLLVGRGGSPSRTRSPAGCSQVLEGLPPRPDRFARGFVASAGVERSQDRGHRVGSRAIGDQGDARLLRGSGAEKRGLAARRLDEADRGRVLRRAPRVGPGRRQVQPPALRLGVRHADRRGPSRTRPRAPRRASSCFASAHSGALT